MALLEPVSSEPLHKWSALAGQSFEFRKLLLVQKRERLGIVEALLGDLREESEQTSARWIGPILVRVSFATYLAFDPHFHWLEIV